jgi:hypothetical protein
MYFTKMTCNVLYLHMTYNLLNWMTYNEMYLDDLHG